MKVRPRPLPAVVAAAATAFLLGACASGGGSAAPSAGTTSAGTGSSAPASGPASADAAGAYPVTIEHAFGETTIEEEPERVVTWGWGSTDAALALDVVPVAIPLASYGANEEGLLPWVAEELDTLGAETPVLIPDTDGIPFEQVAAAEPDLILAVYSGITEEEYRTLSEIAPVVPYPEEAWATPWREVVSTVGTALGKPEQAEELLAAYEEEITAAAEANPELQGRTVAAVWDTADAFYVYEAADPRVEFLTDLGMEVAPSVSELSTGESTFYYTLSPELVGDLESDVLLSYADTEEQAAAFLEQPYTRTLPQVEQGTVASVVGSDVIAAVSPPTILSLPWGLDTYVAELSEAAANVG